MRSLMALALVLGLLGGCTPHDEAQDTMTPQQFIDAHVARVAPLERAANLASWKASVSGLDADYEAAAQAELALETVYADPEAFRRLESWQQNTALDPALRRQLRILYLAYLEKQIPTALLEQLVRAQNVIDQTFSTFRGSIGSESYSDNDLQEILKSSRDSRRLQAAWEASKQVGEVVAPQLAEVVRLRNAAAQHLGYDDYFVLQLELQEFDAGDFMRLFDDLDALTRDAFLSMKADVDKRLARRVHLRPQSLRPWHYQNPFFQEAPVVFDVDLDALVADVDLLEVNRRYYAGLGLPVDSILAHSDLLEKEGKNPHAYCTDIDRQGDVRVFANLRPNEYWMATLLHELGHAVYDQGIDPTLPWVLRTVPHTLSTEAVAMLFGRMSKNADWIQQMLGLPPERADALRDELQRMLTFEQLLFSRWVQVMVRFEQAMYGNPDQDLNALWWRLVQRYQGLTPPEGRDKPDYAAKYHVAMAPVYYHNYLLGELMASQVHETITHQVLHQDDVWRVSYVGRPEVGAYLQRQVFAPGALYGWNELVRHATGEALSPRAFAAQFVQNRATTP